ncbi:MAG: hypothetical protein LBM66_02370, partial [Bifidobacteriaceae bacterium]|nr:hypothetical protein [Bifidobacteriaceae bacterium]
NYYRSLGLQVTTDYMDGVHCWDVWRHLADYFIRNIAFKPQAAPNPNPLDLGPAVTYTGQAPTGYSVTFRFQAPAGADSVSISGDWGFSTPDANGKFTSTHTGASWAPGDAYNFGVSNPMTQGSDGVWSWTTPLPAGTFNYSFTYSCSDGSCATTSTPDPQNLPWSNTAAEIAAGAGQQANSQIYVPESSAFPTYDAAYQAPLPAAEAGTLQTFAYYSKNDQATRYATVWLPPDYDGTRAEGYPTLYISHGGGGDDTDWATQGVAQNIVENEIQAGNASDMVIVMPNINMANGGSGAVGEELGGSLIPAIESHFNVSPSKDERAFAGLSMGAMAGTTLIQGYTDLFGYYGLWSGASVPTGLSAAQLQALKGVKGLMIGAGNQDPLGTIQKDAAPAAQAYADDGVPTVLHMVNGVHCWDVWRQMADYFVKYVAFRPGGPTNGTVTPTPSTDPTTDPTTPATDPTTDPAPTGQIAAFAGTKAFKGKAATGYTLTAPAVTAQPGVALSYRWYVGGTFVSGVATSTYKVRTSDVGERVRVRIVASDDATSVTLVSNQTAKVAKTAKPTIKGTAKAGATLTAVPGSWTDGTTFTYKWTVGGAVVQTGTGASYQVAAADAGQSVKVTVTGKLAGYATVARASAAKAIKG